MARTKWVVLAIVPWLFALVSNFRKILDTHLTGDFFRSYSLLEREKKSPLAEWESIWNDFHSKDYNNGSIGNRDIPLDERQKRWQRLLDVPTKDNASGIQQLKDTFAAFPTPPSDSISFYNHDAYISLISNLLEAHHNGRNFTIVANGGSVTAGGGDPSVPQEDRYYSMLAGYLNTLQLVLGNQNNHDDKTQPPPKVQWVGQGHGFRNSLHTALFFDSFIPSDTDLLIWDFSINDVSTGWKDKDLTMKSSRDNLIAWLSEVNRMKKIPKVLMLYMWNSFERDEQTQRLMNRAYESHGQIARQFDFVVGHVHLGLLVDGLQIPQCQGYKMCPFLTDHVHTSRLGHLATAFLLLSFFDPKIVSGSLPPSQQERNSIEPISYEWNCGNETKAKQVIKDVMTTVSYTTVEWRSPLGAWTSELPVCDQATPRRLVAGPGLGDIKSIGKSDPQRTDRKRATPLYQCDTNTTKSFSVLAPLEPVDDARVLLLTFQKRPLIQNSDIQVRLNGRMANGELVPIRVATKPEIHDQWRCHISVPWSTSVDVYLYVFTMQQPAVNSIEVCTSNTLRKNPNIQSLALW